VKQDRLQMVIFDIFCILIKGNPKISILFAILAEAVGHLQAAKIPRGQLFEVLNLSSVGEEDSTWQFSLFPHLKNAEDSAFCQSLDGHNPLTNHLRE
jgi:hypothetical protein